MNSGFIQGTRFRSILDFHKIRLSDDQYNIILKRYIYIYIYIQLTYKFCRFKHKMSNEIKYVDFLQLLNIYSGDNKMFATSD